MPRREKPRLSLRRPPPVTPEQLPSAAPPSAASSSTAPPSAARPPSAPPAKADLVEAFVEGVRCSPLTIALSEELIQRLHQACTVEAMDLETAVAEALAAWVEAEPPPRYDW
jgi:hypothetical protein